MNTKYELTEEFIELFDGTKLYRIKAVLEFSDVEVGDLGGFIEKIENLHSDCDAWVYGNALVSGNARISGDARVYGDAWVYGDARVYGDALVSGNAWERSPLQIQGSKYFINMASFKILKIGCQEHEISFWLENYLVIAKKHEEPEEIIAEYKLYIDLAAKLYHKEEVIQK